jgi:hypothetical protein
VTVVNLALLAGVLTGLFTGKWSLGVPFGLGATVLLTVAKLFEKRLGDWLAARQAKESGTSPPGGSDNPIRPDVV